MNYDELLLMFEEYVGADEERRRDIVQAVSDDSGRMEAEVERLRNSYEDLRQRYVDRFMNGKKVEEYEEIEEVEDENKRMSYDELFEEVEK